MQASSELDIEPSEEEEEEGGGGNLVTGYCISSNHGRVSKEGQEK
jgi:hypothetical protein